MSADRESDAIMWLAWAMGDLEAARAQPGRHVRPRIVAFNAQQATEKALKAALILAGIDPPRTHDLDDLRNRLPTDWRLRHQHPDLASLADFAVDSRYPDDFAPVTPLQSATAVRQATSIIRHVGEEFERRGVSIAKIKPR